MKSVIFSILLVAVFAAAISAAVLMTRNAGADQPVDLHCPSGGTKTEANGPDLNEFVPDERTSFCVKSGRGDNDQFNTGKLVADGVKTLCDYLIDNDIRDGGGDTCKDVSYYTVYSTTTPTPIPTVTPTPEK